MSSGKTPTPNGKGDARRAAIVRAARDICAEKGFSKVTVSDIANRARMTRSLFYHYFADKSEVADAVLDDVVGSILAQMEEWNANRETGNIDGALNDFVVLTRRMIVDESPFSARLVQDGNAALYIRFLDRVTDRIADLLQQTTARDFEERHDMPIVCVHETFVMLVSGVISLIRSHSDVSNATIKRLIAQTLHLNDYVHFD